jgi:hypothetical protein
MLYSMINLLVVRVLAECFTDPCIVFQSNYDDLPRNLSLICLLLQPNRVIKNFLTPSVVACYGQFLKCMKLLDEVQYSLKSHVFSFVISAGMYPDF